MVGGGVFYLPDYLHPVLPLYILHNPFPTFSPCSYPFPGTHEWVSWWPEGLAFGVDRVGGEAKANATTCRIWVSFKLWPFSIAIVISIVALSAGLLNLCKYLYILSMYIIMWLNFYFVKFQLMSLTIPPFHFRVAKIAFYIEIPRRFWISVNEDYKIHSHGIQCKF
jgi:hypothetical protein